jgi:TRAP-type uncharacterized transport system substrate-binding protein
LPRLALLAAAIALCATPARAAEPDWPDQLRIGTASPGGTYYVYGEALAKILTRTLDLPVERLATEGSVQNIKLEAGEARLGFVTIGVALQAWNGTGVWAGKKPARSMRVIFPMYDTPFQFLVLQELAAQVHERKLDVLAGAAGVPFPSFIELEAKDKVRYVAFTANEIAALRLAIPELTASRIPAGTYPSLLRSYQTLGLFNFAVAHAQLPDDLVYQVVRAVFENQEEMMEANAAAAETIPANIERNTFLPLHPGAIRYYRQIGRAGQTD